jgi:hypothetical protein
MSAFYFKNKITYLLHNLQTSFRNGGLLRLYGQDGQQRHLLYLCYITDDICGEKIF